VTTAETSSIRHAHPADLGAADDLWGIDFAEPAVRRHVRRNGIVALGEAFERGQWETDGLEELMYRVFTSPPPRLSPWVWTKLLAAAADQRLFNRQSGRGAFNIGLKHYDLGNDLFRNMLDESMSYTSGYWAKAKSLEEAQRDKLDLICRKLDLRPGDRVLDIGCGWGNFARYAAKHHGAQVTGITVSREQALLAQQRCLGLPVEIRLQDYRHIHETFDHVVSIEMIEAVGRKNLPTFYRTIDAALEPGGRSVVQVISGDTLSLTSDRGLDQYILWLLKYIFPDGYLPKQDELIPPRDTRLRVDDTHLYVDDYPRTLRAWAGRFEEKWSSLEHQYDDAFRRRWRFYLHGCAAAFRAGLVDVSQIVYVKGAATTRFEPRR
jgi:cyclopropane-fatty-acyl-phospholipid synthase